MERLHLFQNLSYKHSMFGFCMCYVVFSYVHTIQ